MQVPLVSFFRVTVCAMGALAVCSADAQVKLTAGEWAIEARIEGAPGNPEPFSQRTCFTEEALIQPEQAFFDALATASSTRRAPPKCKLGQIKRDGAQATWTGECDGPFGTAPATGSGTLDVTSGQLRQSITLKTPMGTRTLTQFVTTKHVGACSKQ